MIFLIRSFNLVFFPLADDIADHGIGRAGECPYKNSKDAKNIPHRVTDGQRSPFRQGSQ